MRPDVLHSRRHRGYALAILAASFIAIATGASADDKFLQPDPEEMVVTGSYDARSATTIAQSVTRLEGDALDHSISLSLDDALRFVPGLQVTRQGGRGGRTELYLRGLDPNHVVVMIDGVRLNDPTNSRGGSFDPTTLALLDIERVEIIRGPLSAIYGSDALAGAINIITRSSAPGDAPEASVRIRGGRFHEGSAIAQGRGRLGEHVGLSLGAALETYRDPNSDGGFDGANLKAKLTSNLPGDIDLQAFTRLHHSSSRGFPDSSGGSELAVLPGMEDRNVREWLIGAVARKDFEDTGSIELRASRNSRRESLDSPGVDRVPPLDPLGEGDIPVTRSGDEYERWELSALGHYKAPTFNVGGTSHQTSLTVGTNVVWEDGESDINVLLDFGGGPSFIRQPYFDTRRTVGVFGEVEHTIAEAITLSASLRQDFVHQEKDRLSPAAGISVAIPKTTLVLFGNYGEGFKLPSFYALQRPFIGDPNLLTETSRGWEVGLRARALDDRIGVQLSYFDLRVKNLIDFDSSIPLLVNRGRLVSQGVELELNWIVSDKLSLRSGGTWNLTDFQGSSAVPTNRPKWRGFAELVARPIEPLEITLRALAVSSIKATSFLTGAEVRTLNGYERLDLGARWLFNERLDIFVELQNLTNTTPREAIGFESPGISARAGITLRL